MKKYRISPIVYKEERQKGKLINCIEQVVILSLDLEINDIMGSCTINFFLAIFPNKDDYGMRMILPVSLKLGSL